MNSGPSTPPRVSAGIRNARASGKQLGVRDASSIAMKCGGCGEGASLREIARRLFHFEGSISFSGVRSIAARNRIAFFMLPFGAEFLNTEGVMATVAI